MQIVEQDIFDYVHFPEKVTEEKKEYIKLNESLFSEQIQFCKEFQSFDKDKYPGLDIDEMAEEILSNIKIITLFPVKNDEQLKDRQFSLVAASGQIAHKSSGSITFIDDSSKYLVRVVNYNNKNTLYFFPKDDQKSNKFKFTLLPGNETFHLKFPNKSFEIPSADLIQKILIEEE